MRILADENCGPTLLSALRAAGHDVRWIRDVELGMDDEVIFALAIEDTRVLLTYDQDFGYIAQHAMELPPAVLLMRLHGLPVEANAAIVVRTIADMGDTLFGHFVVIEHASFRARPYKD
jgi:predicted nuclease of predicted toxin-antitoxin system